MRGTEQRPTDADLDYRPTEMVGGPDEESNGRRESHGGRRRRRRRRGTLKQQEARTGFALVSPTIVLIFALVILPVLWTVILAFKYLPLSAIQTTGLVEGPYTVDNFTAILQSPEFWSSLRVTLEYSILGTALSIGLGLAAALLVWQPFRGRNGVRAAMLIPYVAPVVGTALVWQTMLNPEFGIVNHVGQNVFGWNTAVPFLSQRTGDLQVLGLTLPVPTALLTVIAFEAWRSFPFAFLFLIARLQSLPREYDDAARVDGATPLQRFRYIVMPQLASVIAILAVLRFIWTFNRFDEVFLLTGGGAGTDVVPVQVYNTLTSQNDVGGAAALTMVLGAVLALALAVYLIYSFAASRRAAT